MRHDENKTNPGTVGEPNANAFPDAAESSSAGASGAPGEPGTSAASGEPGAPSESLPRSVDVGHTSDASLREAEDLFAPPSAAGVTFEKQADDEPADASPSAAAILARVSARRRRLSAMQFPDTREVILAWCLWLLVTWVLLGFGASPAAIRWMVFLSAGGLVMLWPAFRLSQDGFGEASMFESSAPPSEPAASTVVAGTAGASTASASHAPLIHATGSVGAAVVVAASNPVATDAMPQPRSALTKGLILRDWLGMNIIFQAVVWPQIITNRWHADQAMFVSIAVAAWSLLVAALVAWGCQRRAASIRTWVMIAILLVIWGEPVLMLGIRTVLPHWAAAFTWTMHVSPIEALYALTEPATTFEPEPWRPTLIAVLAAASIAWLGVAVGDKRKEPGTK